MILFRKIIFVLLCIKANLFAQKQIELSFPIGISWRSTLINSDIGERIPYNPLIPFISEWNIQGLNFNVGINLKLVESNIGIEYFPNIRYNYIHNDINSTKSSGVKKDGIYEWIIDHRFRLSKLIKSKRYTNYKKIFIGASINNFNKKLVQPNLTTNLQYNDFHLGAEFPIYKKLNLETAFIIIPKNFPKSENSLLYSINLGLRYDIFKL